MLNADLTAWLNTTAPKRQVGPFDSWRSGIGCDEVLEKDRARRYDTPTSGDGHSAPSGHEPIIARRRAPYRFQKVVRRNRVCVRGGNAVLVALALGIAWRLVTATRTSGRSMPRLPKAPRTPKRPGRKRSTLLNEMFASATLPLSIQDQTKGRTVTVVQVLDVALAAGSWQFEGPSRN